MTAAELAALVGGQLVGAGERPVTGVATPEEATATDLVFAVDRDAWDRVARGDGGTVLVDRRQFDPQTLASDRALVVVDDARLAFARAAAALLGDLDAPTSRGVHPQAHVGAGALLGPDVTVGAGAVVEAGVTLGAGAIVHSGCVLRSGAAVGARSTLHPRVTLYGRVVLGADCVVHAGSVLGSPGFGVAPSAEGPVDVPQLGRVVLGDGVVVGANCAIDRGALDDTVLGDGVRLDNLVHVGHGARIGAGAIVAGQSGLAGRAQLGAHSQVAGQVGIDVGARVGDGVQLGSRTWVLPGQVVEGGAWLGSPAAPAGEGRRRLAASKRLPELLRRVRELEAQVAALLSDDE